MRLIVTNGGCRDTLVQTVNSVDENPDFTANMTTACRTAHITLQPSISIANITSYFWDFGDGNTAVSITPTVTNIYTNSGTYTVTLVTTDINGCTDTKPLPIIYASTGPWLLQHT